MILAGFIVNFAILAIVTFVLISRHKLVISDKVVRFLFVIAGFIMGVMFSACCLLFYHPTGSIVYEAKNDIQLHNGTIITAGTTFTEYRAMPEGYDTLMLYVNINGKDVDQLFKKSVVKDKKVVMPYWVNYLP